MFCMYRLDFYICITDFFNIIYVHISYIHCKVSRHVPLQLLQNARNNLSAGCDPVMLFYSFWKL